MDVRSFLTDWTINYIRNRDVLAKRIEDIWLNKDGFDVIIKFNDKLQFFIIMPSIENIDGVIEKIKDKSASLIVLNNEKNLNFLIENWGKLIEYRFFDIYFVNPFSKVDKKWIISPYVHHKICDEGSLAQGLRSMFIMVEPIDEEMAKTMIKV